MYDLPEHVTFVGPGAPDPEQLRRLPKEYAAFLRTTNGIVAFRGGLHIRGICETPQWHSLQVAWTGPEAIHSRYRALRSDDIPIAQDCVGDQFVLRAAVVHRLAAETGDLETLGVGFEGFLERAEADPVGYLSLEPLLDFERGGGRLAPGDLLSVYPPFCAAEAANGVSLRPVPAQDRIAWLADFAAQISALPDGRRVEIGFGDP